jgi:hypothetical protein
MTGGRMRLGAVVAVGLLIAFALWVVLSRDDAEPPPSQSTPAQASPTGPPLSQSALLDRVQSSGARVYWVGPRDRTGYELTTTRAGRAFVRYLPAGVNPGDPRPDFLTVATYPLPSGLSALRRTGRQHGAQTVRLQGGALVYTNREKPTSAYVARPGWKFQVEVYHPKPGEAMRLVLAGDVQPVR